VKKSTLLTLLLASPVSLFAQSSDSVAVRRVFDEILAHGKSYAWLRQLTKGVGPRLSGSAGYQQAVEWAKKTMEAEGFDRVFLQEVKVPHWVRGEKERATILDNTQKTDVPIAALGGSVATPNGGITAEVVEVKSFPELRALGREKVAGRIVFFNRPMDPTKLNPFEAYGGAVDQRAAGATEAAKLGAVGAIIRSMNPSLDDFPHTGSLRYGTGVALIPAAAISTNGADLLSARLKANPSLKFFFQQACETRDDATAYNVVGEIRGSAKPGEILLVGGHLDSWDLSEGAHDDGAGCVQAIEVLRTFRALGIQPRHTLRAVLFANEENGLRGGVKYADLAREKGETHRYAIESDNGGFTPRSFGIVGNAQQVAAVQRFASLLAPYGLHEIGRGSGGADIGPLGPLGTVLIGFKPDSQRYFDVHHAATDRFEAVSERELKLGAASMAALVVLLDSN
jgi:hypothetical protein